MPDVSPESTRSDQREPVRPSGQLYRSSAARLRARVNAGLARRQVVSSWRRQVVLGRLHEHQYHKERVGRLDTPFPPVSVQPTISRRFLLGCVNAQRPGRS